MGKERAWGMVVTMTRFTGSRFFRAAYLGQSRSRVMSVSAPASQSWWVSSVSMYSGLVMTTAAPALRAAQ